MQIGRRTILGDSSRRPDIASVFARPAIPGYIFLEGSLFEVGRAVQDLVTVFNHIAPRLVPLEQRVALLSPRNPLSRPIKEGQWVRCLHGLYRGDIGFVCGHDPTRDAETVVALAPRIPEKTTRTAKRKKRARPEPRSWSLQQVEAAWGASKVRRISADEYIFGREKYKSGLLIARFPPASLANVDSAPNDLRPFLRASYIRNIASFAPWIHRFTQDSIKPGQLVKVESGDHRGAIGKPLDVVHSVASLLLNSTGNGPALQIPLRDLAPFYERGHHIKSRWSESSGIVMSVDEVHNTLFYVDKDSQNTVSTSISARSCLTPSQIAILIDAVEPYDPPLNFYRVTAGTWVEFNGQRETDQPKRRGYVRVVEETHALVIDEHTLAEVRKGMHTKEN